MDAAWALEVMDKAPYITVSMTDVNGMPYSVPLSLARTDGQTFYFHCATEGKKLDELHKAVEVGKRPYQNVLKVIISAVVTAAICFLIGLLMHIFLN